MTNSFLKSALLALGLVLASLSGAQAQSNDTGWMTRDAYQSFLDRRAHGDLVPYAARAAVIEGQLQWRAFFHPRPEGLRRWQLRTGRNDAGFEALNSQYSAQGYTLAYRYRQVLNGRVTNQAVWYLF